MDEQNTEQPDTRQFYAPETGPNQYDAGNINTYTEGVPMEQLPGVQWSASEYIAHDKTILWHLAFLGVGAGIALVIFLTTRDPITSAAVLVASGAMSVYAGRKPETKNYYIDDAGIKVDDRMYQYSMFKSFAVVEEGGIDSIWLKPLKRISPMVVMYFPPDQEDHIVDVLANFLPHEQRELDFVDRLSKRMRF
jgi:hypothetical protein